MGWSITVSLSTTRTPVAFRRSEHLDHAESAVHLVRNAERGQVDTGAGFQNADTSGLPGGALGTAFTSTTSTFSEVADALRHKVRVSVDAERYSVASAVFAGNGLGTATVIDHTFYSVDLVGRPITVGHIVTINSLNALFAATSHT